MTGVRGGAVILALLTAAACSSSASARSGGVNLTSPAPVSSQRVPTGERAAAFDTLPDPAFVAQGVSSANSAHLLRNQQWDFAQMRHAFNTVALLPGDPATVQAARRAGLAVILEFDFKKDFVAGVDITPRVDAVIAQARAAPGAVAAVHVADRINEKLTPGQALAYLAATGGRIHRRLPGLPVLVNAADWELTCGSPGQTRCYSSGPAYRFETSAVLDTFVHSGYIDGFTIADNVKNNDTAAQVAAWKAARARWPAPFLLLSTCSQVSFPEPRYPGTASTAAATVATYVDAPLHSGADGVALWAWRQSYDGSDYTILDKDGGPNALWNRLNDSARAAGVGE